MYPLFIIFFRHAEILRSWDPETSSGWLRQFSICFCFIWSWDKLRM